MAKPLIEQIPQYIMKKWDKWDYNIYSPLSLEDNDQIIVVLKNRNGDKVRLVGRLGELTEEV